MKNKAYINAFTLYSDDLPDIYNEVIPTGMNYLDALLEGGFRKGDLNIIAARPAMGKTTFATQLASNIAAEGKKVCYFSLEMTEEQIKSLIFTQRNRDIPIIIDKPNMTTNYIKNQIIANKADVAFVDYISLVSTSRNIKKPKERVSKVAHKLKRIAEETAVTIICLTQLPRYKGDRPELNDLMLGIEQDASVVLFPNRDAYYGNIDSIRAEIIVGKNQYGSSDTIEATFNSEKRLFIEKKL